MYEILRSAIERNASDIHITENQIGWLRVQGELEKFEHIITLDMFDYFVQTNMSNLLDLYNELKAGKYKKSIDGAFKFSDRRFRINIYLGMNGINAAMWNNSIYRACIYDCSSDTGLY